MASVHVVNRITRRPDLDRAAFRTYYETRHAPLGSRYFAFEKYLRNHVVAMRPDDLPIDCIMECWFDRDRAMADLIGDVDRLFREDEGRFMTERGIGVNVEETLVSGEPRGYDASGTRKVLWLLKRPADATGHGFTGAARNWAKALPGASLSRVTLAVALPEQDMAGFPCDAVVFGWCRDGAAPPFEIDPPAALGCVGVLLCETAETSQAELHAAFGKRDMG